MGRTVASFTQLIYKEEEEWRRFRRALRKEDKECLDRLFAYARMHAAECAYSGRLLPFDAMVISMLIELLKRVEKLEMTIPDS